VRESLLRDGGTGRFVEVVGKLGQMRFEVLRVELLERIADAPVKLHSPPRRELVVKRVADQNVREAHTTGLAGHVAEDPLPRRFVENLETVIAADVAHP